MRIEGHTYAYTSSNVCLAIGLFSRLDIVHLLL